VSLNARIAAALGAKWTEKDVRSFSLLTIREMVRVKHPKLAAEITALVASGEHITGGADAHHA